MHQALWQIKTWLRIEARQGWRSQTRITTEIRRHVTIIDIYRSLLASLVCNGRSDAKGSISHSSPLCQLGKKRINTLIFEIRHVL